VWPPAANRAALIASTFGLESLVCQNRRVSPKSRGRKKPVKRQTRPARTAPTPAPGQAGQSAARAPAGPTRPDLRKLRDGFVAGVDAVCVELYSEAEHFRPLLSAADPLAAELRTAQLLARFTKTSPSGAVDLELGLVALAARHPQPHVAAMTAAVGWLLPGMATSMALSHLASQGVRPPAWHERIGDVTPGRAWRYRDVFGDQEAVLVTFFYDDAEHAMLVETVTCPTLRVRGVHMSTTTTQLRTVLQKSADETGEQRIMEEISLQQAHAALAQAVQWQPHGDAEPDSLVFLPIVRRRVERLPGPERIDEVGYTTADRAAAVEEFLAAASPPPGTDGRVKGATSGIGL